LLLVQSLLAGDLQLLVDVPKLEQQRGRARVHRRYRAREVELRLPGDGELELLLGVGRAAALGHVDRGVQSLRIGKDLVRSKAHQMLLRELEQVFRSRIGVGHAARVVEHEHRRRQQLEAGARTRRILAGKRSKRHRDHGHGRWRCRGNGGGVDAIATQQFSRPPGARAPRGTVT
jgi:hypothetical protein